MSKATRSVIQNNDYSAGITSFGLSSEYSPEVTNRVQALFNEDLSFVIRRLIVHEGIEKSLANKLKTEFLRFVALKQQYSGMLVPSALIDNFWHAFILHTEEYTDFCQRHLGCYMHHRPQDHPQTKVINDNVASRRTIDLLEKMFPDYDKSLWTESAICSGDGDCGCP